MRNDPPTPSATRLKGDLWIDPTWLVAEHQPGSHRGANMSQRIHQPASRRASSRREFLSSTFVGATSLLAAPAILTAAKTDADPVTGQGDHRYTVSHNWPQLPSKYSWQTTHGVTLDRAGNLYVIHEGHVDKPDHPAIFVFDSTGRFVPHVWKSVPGWWPWHRGA